MQQLTFSFLNETNQHHVVLSSRRSDLLINGHHQMAGNKMKKLVPAHNVWHRAFTQMVPIEIIPSLLRSDRGYTRGMTLKESRVWFQFLSSHFSADQLTLSQFVHLWIDQGFCEKRKRAWWRLHSHMGTSFHDVPARLSKTDSGFYQSKTLSEIQKWLSYMIFLFGEEIKIPQIIEIVLKEWSGKGGIYAEWETFADHWKTQTRAMVNGREKKLRPRLIQARS